MQNEKHLITQSQYKTTVFPYQYFDLLYFKIRVIWLLILS